MQGSGIPPPCLLACRKRVHCNPTCPRPVPFCPCRLPSGSHVSTHVCHHIDTHTALHLCHLCACRLPSDSRVTRCDLVTAIPVMYYRPAQPQGAPHVRFTLKTGSSVKRVATLVEKLFKDGTLTAAGFDTRTRGSAQHEVEVGGAAGVAGVRGAGCGGRGERTHAQGWEAAHTDTLTFRRHVATSSRHSLERAHCALRPFS
jgi:hypothetical protein